MKIKTLLVIAYMCNILIGCAQNNNALKTLDSILKMKKTIYTISFTLILILIGVTVAQYFYKSSTYLEKHQSPDGKYELVIKNERIFFTSTMPGDGGTSRPVVAILKNANGKTIGKSSDNNNCGVLWFSINVTWDLENGQVWYAKSKTINLKTGKVEC